MEDERRFVESLAAGERPAWERFLREHGTLLVRAAAAVLARAGAAGEAEDVAQKVLALLLENDRRLLRTFQGRSRFSTWLVGIVRHQALMALREKRRPLPPPPRPATKGPLDEAEAAEAGGNLAAALESIAPRERLILKLHYEDGLPYERIARVLGVSANSVSPLLERARERQRRALGNRKG